MGQSQSSDHAEAAAASTMEMASMSAPLPGSSPTGTHNAVGSPTCAVAGGADAATVSIFCLDTAAGSVQPFLELMRLPPAQRPAAFAAASTGVSGVLLHAPASTSIAALKVFLLAQTAAASPAAPAAKAALDALHVFAVRAPSHVHSDAAATTATASPAAATSAPSSEALVALPEAATLSTLAANGELFRLFVAGVDGNVAVNPLEDAAAAVAAPAPSELPLVLLYSHEASFGFDGDDMLLIGCCVAICACVAAAICCCVSAAKDKNAQNNQNNGGNVLKPQDYNNGNYNNGNNGNYNNAQYYNNGNGNSYYGQQPNYNYNPGSGAPGYGMPPNAYQPQQPNYYNGGYQYQQQNPQLNGQPMQPASYNPSGPAPNPL